MQQALWNFRMSYTVTRRAKIMSTEGPERILQEYPCLADFQQVRPHPYNIECEGLLCGLECHLSDSDKTTQLQFVSLRCDFVLTES